MVALLLSFLISDGGDAQRIQSHVVQVDTEPDTWARICELMEMMAIQYGAESAMYRGSFVLPDHEGHPCGRPPFYYVATFWAVGGGQLRMGCRVVNVDFPILTTPELRVVEETVRDGETVSDLHITNLTPVQAVSDTDIAAYEERWRKTMRRLKEAPGSEPE